MTDFITRAPRTRRKRWRLLRDLVMIVLIAILAAVLIRAFLVRSFYIPSGSMESTLLRDDRILVNELTPRLLPVERGDVVVFRDPGGWLHQKADASKNPAEAIAALALDAVGLAASDSDQYLVKRVIGRPGDHVVCCNALGQITVNDVPLDEPYVKVPAAGSAASGTAFDVTVPPRTRSG